MSPLPAVLLRSHLLRGQASHASLCLPQRLRGVTPSPKNGDFLFHGAVAVAIHVTWTPIDGQCFLEENGYNRKELAVEYFSYILGR